MVAGVNTLQSFASLIAGTNCTAVAWADNYSGLTMASANATAQTTDVPAPAIVSFAFAETITESEVSNIQNAAAQTLNILASRFEQFGAISRRRLSSIVTSALIAGTRSNVTPLTLGTSLSTMSATLLANIIASGVVVAGVTTSARISTSADYPSPVFSAITITNETDGVMFNFTSSVTGYVCCIGELDANTNYSLSSYDVMFQEDRLGGAPAFASCWDAVAATNYSEFLNFTAQTSVANGTYLFTCTDCNNYPIMPDCIADSALVQDSFTWPVATGSLNIMVALCAILAYLL